VLYVGRFSPEKNLATLVDAVGRCRARPRLVLVGAGPERDALVARARRVGTELELPGVVDQRALPARYGSAHAFVLASFTEGHPKVLLEAMATALPCVVSDCDGNRSLVTDGVTGLVFDPHRADELAAGLDRVLGDGALAAALGARARAEIVARYDLRALVAREIALVREIAGG
jgi:glycosyltransferase involved in cell wall biosynthesis